MWARFVGWLSARGREPILVVSHAPPRDVNDDDDLAHRGFTRLPVADRPAPASAVAARPHRARAARARRASATRHAGTLFYNCTGATLIELVAADG